MRLAVLIAVVLVPIAAAAHEPCGPVVCDSDTLNLGGAHYRLTAIDAPELDQSCDSGAWHPGPLARDALLAIIVGRPVRCEPLYHDRYGRTVARCFADGVDLGREMVAQGWALAYRRYGLEYVDAENAAKAAGLGLHAHHCLAPWDCRASQRGG